MDDKLTKTFLRVCQEGSIRAAALALAQEPSTISRRIAALESQLAITLLERRKKGVSPTEAGALLLDHLRRSAAERETLMDDFDALRGLRRGSLTLGVGDGFLSDLIRNALPRFHSAHPQISVSLRSGTTETVLGDVESDAVHLGLVFHAGEARACTALSAQRQPLELLLSPQLSWADLPAPVRLAQLAQVPLVQLTSGSGVGALLRAAEAVHAIRLSPVIEADSLSAIRDILREGLAASILPAFVAARDIAEGQIVALPLDVPELARGEARLVTRAGRRLPAAALKFAHIATRHMLAFRRPSG